MKQNNISIIDTSCVITQLFSTLCLILFPFLLLNYLHSALQSVSVWLCELHKAVWCAGNFFLFRRQQVDRSLGGRSKMVTAKTSTFHCAVNSPWLTGREWSGSAWSRRTSRRTKAARLRGVNVTRMMSLHAEKCDGKGKRAATCFKRGVINSRASQKQCVILCQKKKNYFGKGCDLLSEMKITCNLWFEGLDLGGESGDLFFPFQQLLHCFWGKTKQPWTACSVQGVTSGVQCRSVQIFDVGSRIFTPRVTTTKLGRPPKRKNNKGDHRPSSQFRLRFFDCTARQCISVYMTSITCNKYAHLLFFQCKHSNSVETVVSSSTAWANSYQSDLVINWAYILQCRWISRHCHCFWFTYNKVIFA